MSTHHGELALRPITPQDWPFISQLYASTRVVELSVTGWDEATVRIFCDNQARLQDADYRARYPDDVFRLITEDGRAVGRWYAHRGAGEWRVVEVTVHADARRRGIARTLLEGFLAEAAEARVPVTLHVEPAGVAFDWYRRLGFSVVEPGAVHSLLRWEPPDPAGRGTGTRTARQPAS